VSDWISVDDELPELDFDVLVRCDDDVIISTFRSGYTQGDWWFDIERESTAWLVTHWMPLPEPPKQGGAE
jgi:hypothetical protein